MSRRAHPPPHPLLSEGLSDIAAIRKTYEEGKAAHAAGDTVGRDIATARLVAAIPGLCDDVGRLTAALIAERAAKERTNKGGRPAAAPTTADGKLVARACKRLGITAAALAERIGAHEAVLSRARHGELPAHHRDAIRALLKGKGKGAS